MSEEMRLKGYPTEGYPVDHPHSNGAMRHVHVGGERQHSHLTERVTEADGSWHLVDVYMPWVEEAVTE